MGRKPDPYPSKKCLEVFEYLVRHIEQKGYQPSQQEMAEFFQISKTALVSRLRRLHTRKLIELPSGNRERAIILKHVNFEAKGSTRG